MKNKYTKRGAFTRKVDKWLSIVTGDYVITHHPRMIGGNGEECAFILLDIYSGMIGGYPSPNKSAEDVQLAVEHLSGRCPIDTLYTDNAPEIARAAKYLHLHHETSAPGRHTNNSLAERTNQIVIGVNLVSYVC